MAMGRVYKPLLDALGITYPQYLVLHALWEEDGRTVGGIAERLSLERSTVTPLVKRLAVAGLVDRARDPADERHVRVALTERGRAFRVHGDRLTAAIFSRTGLTTEQASMLTEQVQALRRTLGGVETSA